jgi:hypothetical protein
MKFVTILAIAVAVVSAKRDTTKIALLKQKVTSSQQQFATDGFKNSPVGTMTIAVNVGKPISGVSLSKEEQTPSWKPVTLNSPLKAQGYTQWMSVNGGMVFKNAKSEMVACDMKASAGAEEGKLILDYNCKPMDKARFAQMKVTYWKSGTLTHQDVPSGWNTRWGPFDYPFYTTTSQGILGCKNTSGGYCTPQHADLFPFESCYSDINEAGEAKALCEKRKAEKKAERDQLEKEVLEQEKDEDKETAQFFGQNYEDAKFEGMQVNEEMARDTK